MTDKITGRDCCAREGKLDEDCILNGVDTGKKTHICLCFVLTNTLETWKISLVPLRGETKEVE